MQLRSLVITVAMGCSKPSPPMHAIDLADAPVKRVGSTVVVDVVEDLLTNGGIVGVDLPEHGPVRLGLVPEAPLDAGIFESPMRVRGVLERRFKSGTFEKANDCCFVIRATSVEPLSLPTAEPAPSIDEILANRSRWDRRSIVYEGVWVSGWEWSALDGRICLNVRGDAGRVASRLPKPPHGESRVLRVRASGVLFSHGKGYCHLDQYPLELLASKLEILGELDGGLEAPRRD